MFQNWGGSKRDGNSPYRMHRCGHVVELACPADSFPCPICGELQVWCTLPKGPRGDYVPTPDLAWPGATLTSSFGLERFMDTVRCEGSGFVCLDDLQPCDARSWNTITQSSRSYDLPRRGTVISGKNHAVCIREVQSVEDFVSAVSHRPLSELCLGSKMLPVRTPPEPQSAATFAVLKASTTGVIVRSGCVVLRKDTVLLFTGDGIHFSGTCFSGGVIVCAGPQFSGTFQNCDFCTTPIYVANGAHAALRGCTVRSGLPGLTASGTGTFASLASCRFNACEASLHITCGAVAAVRHCWIHNTDAAVVICGDGAHGSLDETYVQGSVNQKGIRGVAVKLRSGTARLRRCVIAAIETAAAVTHARAAVEAQEVHLVDCLYGVVLRRHTLASVRDCVLKMRSRWGVTPAEGISMGRHPADVTGVNGASAQVERAWVQADAGFGMLVSAGSRASATLCCFEGPAQAVVAIAGPAGGRVTLAHCMGGRTGHCLLADGRRTRLRVCGGLFEGCLDACVLQREAVLTATDATFRGRLMRGAEEAGVNDFRPWGVVRVQSGARGLLRGCDIMGGYVGLLVQDASAYLADVTVSDVLNSLPHRVMRDSHGVNVRCAGSGVYCDGAHLTWSRGRLERCLMGVEIAAKDTPCCFVMSEVVLRDCVVGLWASGRYEFWLSRCELLGPRRERGGEPPVDLRNLRLRLEESDGMSLEGAGRGAVTECKFVGWRCGAKAFGTVAAAFGKCSFTVSGGVAVAIASITEGLLSITECEFVGVPPPSAAAGGQRESQQLAMHPGGSGLACVAGGMEVLRCRFVGLPGFAMSAVGFAAGRVSRMTVVGTSVVCGGAGRCKMGFMINQNAHVEARDCRLDGLRGGVVMKGGTLRAVRLAVTRAEHGLEVGCEMGPSRVELVDSDLRFHRAGVFASGHRVQISLQRVVIVGTGDATPGAAGARFQTGAVGHLDACKIEGVDSGVVVGDDTPEDVPVGEAPGLPPDAALLFSALGLPVGTERGRAGAERAASRVTLSNVEVASELEGVCVRRHGILDATCVTVLNSDVGFKIESAGETAAAGSRMVGCQAVGCGVRVLKEKLPLATGCAGENVSREA